MPASWTPRLSETAKGYRPWLLDRGSLTRRLKARCRDFSVRLVREAALRPEVDEALIIGSKRDVAVRIREVYLHCDGKPVVFAHSVLPRDLEGTWHNLHGLGSRPLGEALFSDPRVTRTPLVYSKLSPHSPLYQRAGTVLPQKPTHLWARRSVFALGCAPILVTEIFLPAILELPR